MSSLSVGLLYIAPFIGGVLGSSISGKVSDIVCRWMTRHNGGIFEPEFRLVMVIPVAIATVIGNPLLSPKHPMQRLMSRTLGVWLVHSGPRSMDRPRGIFRCNWVWMYPRFNRLSFICRRFISCRCRILSYFPQLF